VPSLFGHCKNETLWTILPKIATMGPHQLVDMVYCSLLISVPHSSHADLRDDHCWRSHECNWALWCGLLGCSRRQCPAERVQAGWSGGGTGEEAAPVVDANSGKLVNLHPANSWWKIVNRSKRGFHESIKQRTSACLCLASVESSADCHSLISSFTGWRRW